MPTPSELVTTSFATAKDYANDAKTALATFTNALNTAVQTAPLVDVSFAPIADPGFEAAPIYEAPTDYSSPLLTTMSTTLTTRMAGGTGLDATVEAAIWDRAREREVAVMQANIDQVTRDSEALGFQLPPGVLVDSIRRETRGYNDRVATISRDIAIKQAELEQANMHKIIEQGVSFEGVLADIRYKRSQVSLGAYQADIQRFQAEVDQDVKHWEVAIKQYEATITYTLNAQKINAEIIRANLGASLDAAKVGAQVYSQLVASAYSMIHASAGVSASAGMSVSYSYSNDTATAPPSVTAV